MLTTMLITELMELSKMSPAEVEEQLVKIEIKELKHERLTQQDVLFQMLLAKIPNEVKQEITAEAKCRLGL
jgi:hypothetical protein